MPKLLYPVLLAPLLYAALLPLLLIALLNPLLALLLMALLALLLKILLAELARELELLLLPLLDLLLALEALDARELALDAQTVIVHWQATVDEDEEEQKLPLAQATLLTLEPLHESPHTPPWDMHALALMQMCCVGQLLNELIDDDE
jgi:hypothetical protein